MEIAEADEIVEACAQVAWAASLNQAPVGYAVRMLKGKFVLSPDRSTVLEEAALECQRVADIGEGPQGVTRATALWLRDNIRALKDKPASATSPTNAASPAVAHQSDSGTSKPTPEGAA